MTEPLLSENGKAEPLHDNVVLLVGVSRIGSRSLAVSLAERGADISFLHANDQYLQVAQIKRRVEEHGQRCLAIPARTDGQISSRNVVGQIVENLGRLDIFIDYGALSGDLHTGECAEMRADRRNAGRANPFSHFGLVAAAIRQMVDNDQTT
jgi:NAD(P)-dependent dehydrogenase (short-subunit alcohol dehydrogenase family)